jgi:ATP-dependent RNA helicase DeaD
VISLKKARIKDEIVRVMESEDCSEYIEMAEEMLTKDAPEKVLAALLKHSFQEELDERNYNEIREVSVDNKGKTSLFVALGRADGMTPQKLVDFIKHKARVDAHKIKDVRIFDKISFITVPFEEAEIILKTFKKEQSGRRPIIERARPKKLT